MKLNGINTTVAKYKSEMLECEMIIYCVDSHKIIVLNKTSIFIFREIENAAIANTNITIEDIVQSLIERYGLSLLELNCITADVTEAVDMMIKASLLIQ